MVKFYREVLDNGMTVLFEKRDIPVVSVAFAVRAGGINESKDEKGISHFIEHMLYKGTEKRNARQVAKEIEGKGGVLNGFTDEEITAFWCKMPSEHLGIALDVLGDLVKNPKFDEKELEKERKVIFEEIKMRKDNPTICVFDKITSYLYEEPLGIPLIGDEKILKSIDRDKIVKKFKQLYSPNNLVLCVVGDAKFEDILDFAKKNFGKKESGVPQLEIKSKNKIGVEERKGLDQANLILAYHVPNARDKNCYAAEILNEIMAGGMSSRLFHEIREKRNLAYSVKGGSEINKRFAFNLIYVGTTKENVEKVKELILEELKKIEEGLSEKELEEAKEQVIGNQKISMEDSQEQMVHLLRYEIFGNAKKFYDFEKNFEAVEMKDVKELAKNARQNYSFFALLPE